MKTDLEQLFENAKVDLTKELKEYLENECSELNEELLLELEEKRAGNLLKLAENSLVNSIQIILNKILNPATRKNSYYIKTSTYIIYTDNDNVEHKIPLCVITDNYRKRNPPNVSVPSSAGMRHIAQHILNVSNILYGVTKDRFYNNGNKMKTT